VWKLKKNPDITCIPLLTATGDLLGVAFLFLAFHLVYMTGNTSVATPVSDNTSLEAGLFLDQFNVTLNGTNGTVDFA
jgi:hypothetical protein